MNPIGTLGFGLAAAAYGGLTVLLLVSWQGRREGGRLIIATAATTLWSVGLLVEAANLGVPALAVTLVEKESFSTASLAPPTGNRDRSSS